MPMQKVVYIHFETKPAFDCLTKFFSKFRDYQKVFATSYLFRVPRGTPNERIHDWAQDCFPYDAYAICVGPVAVRYEHGLAKEERPEEWD